jgi:HAAS domain-containing protein
MKREAYLRSVGFRLRDLPWSTRRDLLAELRGHLDELPPDTILEARLGTPEAYADDLRSAAGLGRCRGPIAFLRARRPRDLILAVVALALIGVVISAARWVDSYQPLAFQGGEEPPLGTSEVPGGTSQFAVFRKGRPFRYGLDIENTGQYTVRVLGVPLGPGRQVFSTHLVMSGPTPGGGFPRPYMPFHPFDMKPGEVRVLELQGVYAHCRYWTGGGSTLLTDFPIRYRFLWHTATAEIPLPEPLAIVFPKGFRCFSKP